MQNTKRIVKDWLGGALLAAILCAGTVDAHAQNSLLAEASDTQLVATWQEFNEHCHGDQIAPLYNPACKAAGNVARRLYARKWTLANHDVWVSPDAVDTVNGAVLGSQVSLAQDLGIANIKLATVQYLRNHGVTDPQLIAIWNANAADYRDTAPGGWAVVSEIVGALARRHAGDPRYQLDNQ